MTPKGREPLNGAAAVLVPVGDFPPDLLQTLSRRSGLPLGPARIDPSTAWNADRGQYESGRLLAELRRTYHGAVVAATALDLFVPVLTFVFGEADMSGRAAIFSIHRLREEFYGLPRNSALLEERALRELRHEYGHLRGLAHCEDWSCVMSSSHSVERVDAKSEEYCVECREKMAPASRDR